MQSENESGAVNRYRFEIHTRVIRALVFGVSGTWKVAESVTYFDGCFTYLRRVVRDCKVLGRIELSYHYQTGSRFNL